jgi:hypothetical protein
VIVLGWIALAFSVPARAWQESATDDAKKNSEGEQVLTQGPIHEAFAQPVLYDPKAGPLIPKTPPEPISEVPPDQKPEGANVQWIPGYWAWDDGRGDFIWVSGVWRAIPPGRQWVPGYWQKVQGGSQWVPGYWSGTDATQTQYLPEPPASLENGPSSPPPSPEATWSPGMWAWQDSQYLWRPGFWVNNQPGWMWNPASYSYTPNGYIYNQGFWDYPLANRGIPFAPVYFSGSAYTQPNFQYTPGVGLLTSSLLSSMFVRPSYGSYYFGDYYAPGNFQSGIYPWYSFHGSRYGYDPLYAYTAAQNFRTNPRWADELHQTYTYRREHPDARPPHTFAQTRMLAARPVEGASPATGAANLVLARPLSQIATTVPGGAANASAANSNAMRFERLNEARRQEFARQGAQVHQFREERSRRELEAGRTNASPARAEARHLEAPRSPITAVTRGGGAQFTPPPVPSHPQVERAVRNSAAPTRHEPHPDIRPPAPFTAPARPASPSPAPATGPAPGPGPRRK